MYYLGLCYKCGESRSLYESGYQGDLKGFIPSKEFERGRSVIDAKEGQVMLCTIIGLSSNGKIVKLSGGWRRKKWTETKALKVNGGSPTFFISRGLASDKWSNSIERK